MRHPPAFVLRPILVAALLFGVDCGSDTGVHVSSGAVDASTIDGSAIDTSAIDTSAIDGSTIDGNFCNVVVQSQINGGHLHTANDCDAVTYPTNPPSSGTHYPDWAMYKTYTSPVPWGFLVHDTEHGGIVITYNCPEGCADELAQAQALIKSLAPDKSCASAPMKVVLAPAPDLDVRWAAAAWTWTLRASCFDRQAFASFIATYYGGPDTEAACGGGIDRSATGWCP